MRRRLIMVVAAGFSVRPMTLADISQVVDVERESFPTTWPQTAYRRELANKFARYLVLVDTAHPRTSADPAPARRSFFGLWRHREPEPQTTDRIVGYVGMWLVMDQAHIVAIAVRERYRRQGLGELLLIEAIDLAIENGMDSLTLEVRRTNSGAQALYDKYRFLKVGVRRRYYSDNNEDAIIMTTPSVNHASYQEHLQFLKDRYRERWGREV